jgi:starch phosphorylase
MDLYRILEDDVVPEFFDRGAGASRGQSGPPARWVERMRRSMASTLWQFSTTRMLHEYTERLYLPAAGIVTDRTAEAPSA